MVEELMWHGLKVGDLATWAGALGSISAVVTALWLAKSDSRRRDSEAAARGRVMASFLFAEVGLLNRRVEEAINQAIACKTFKNQNAMEAINHIKSLFEGIDASKFSSNLDKLAHLPGSHGEFLAAVPDIRRVMVTACTWRTAFPLPKDAHEIADSVLPQLHAMKKNTSAFVAEYEPKFAT
jgi:predicted outer membrane lipoprotein